MKKYFVLLIAILVIASSACLPIMADSAGGELTGEELLTAAGLDATGFGFGSDNVETAYFDEVGRLVVKPVYVNTKNCYIAPILDDSVKGIKDYTIEVRIMGVEVENGWHYGLGLNNSVSKGKEPYFTYRSGAYAGGSSNGMTNGQIQCRVTGLHNTEHYLGAPNTAFSEMSSVVGAENTLSITHSSANQTLCYKINGVEVATLKPTATFDASLTDFSVIIPCGQTVAICYMKVYNGNGDLVLDKDFSGVDENAPEHNLTVNYVYENGEKAADSVVRSIKEGAYYSVASPSIAGYTAKTSYVAGAMGEQDISVTVIYEKVYKVTIHYIDDLGNTVVEDYVEELKSGETYSVDVFPVANHTVNQTKIEGTITDKDVEHTVTYVRKTHRLTIKYQYADGTVAHADYIENIKHGEKYSVDSPVIDGFVANKTTVAANSMTKDVNVTVVYTAVSNDSATTADTSSESEGGCGSTVGVFTLLPILMGGAFFVYRRKED